MGVQWDAWNILITHPLREVLSLSTLHAKSPATMEDVPPCVYFP